MKSQPGPTFYVPGRTQPPGAIRNGRVWLSNDVCAYGKDAAGNILKMLRPSPAALTIALAFLNARLLFPRENVGFSDAWRQY